MKTVKHLFFPALVLLFLSTALFAQQKTNPFSVKVKKGTPPQHFTFTPQPLKAIPQSKSTVPVSLTANPVVYHPVPFSKPMKGDFKNTKINKNHQVIYTEGKPYNLPVDYSSRSEESMEQAAYNYLNSIKEAMLINQPETEFRTMDLHTDNMGFDHLKMQQYYKGIKVYGGQIILHGQNNSWNCFNGTYYPTPEISGLNPALSALDATEVVTGDLPSYKSYEMLTPFEKTLLQGYTGPETELIIYHPNRDAGSEMLCYHISIMANVLDRWEYFIDAQTGQIVHKYKNMCSDGPATATAVDLNGVSRTINTYLKNGYYYLIDATRPMFNPSQSDLPNNPVGALWTIDAQNSSPNNASLYQLTSVSNVWNNPKAVSAHYNAGIAYEYYKNTHSRNSLDGNGGTIISVINMADDDGGGLDNAFWNGYYMCYGNGRILFYPLAGGLDVAAHEMTHGVIQHTANLEYQYESGAINEACADIAGSMVDRDDWHIGEDIIMPGGPYTTGYLRDMSNPHNGGTVLGDAGYQPMHVDEMYHGSEDNGGVHINSGVINYAYYLFATAVSKSKAEKVYYRALTQYMTMSSQFIDCRLAFEKAAKDLYGDNSSEYQAVVSAFYQVGIGDNGGGGGGGTQPGNLPVNPGDDFILSYDVNSSDPNTLYISNTDGTEFIPVSTTSMKRKVSLVDNGSFGIYIGEDNSMNTIDLDTYDEQTISPDYIWDNAAVSKDGSRVAAITTDIDSAIYVYDYSLGWKKFHLYNPTFTPGITTDNVLYADAIEWDYSGDFILYDAYNTLQNNNGEDIDYWDMNLIRVWNSATNSWGDGQIFKIFATLPEGISVGNPCLSKNAPYIFTFDYLDGNTGEMDVMAVNLETGETGVIFSGNQVLGFPNYSKLDNKIIFGAQSTNGNEVVAVIDLQSDKIHPSGSASVLIDYAKWPVWYATGNRNLNDIGERDDAAVFVRLYPNPVHESMNISFVSDAEEEYNIAIYDVTGTRLIYRKGKTEIPVTNKAIDFTLLPRGTYIVKINTGSRKINRKIVKL